MNAQQTPHQFPRLPHDLRDECRCSMNRSREMRSNHIRSWRVRRRTRSGVRLLKSNATSGFCRRPGLRQRERECRLSCQTLLTSFDLMGHEILLLKSRPQSSADRLLQRDSAAKQLFQPIESENIIF